MYPTNREQQQRHNSQNPSFSSTLLDQIYRSIDHAQAMPNKHNSLLVKEELTAAAKVGAQSQRGQRKTRTETKSGWHNQERDREVMFFSSTSCSSDSSSGLLSSSDTESLYGTRSKSRVSCFAPSRPIPKHGEEVLIKSKSRALKIYNNLKKVKQPISPGGRLSNFLNSLFATGNVNKKSKASKSGQDSTVSSFSRSCPSKATTPSSSNTDRHRHRHRDGVKRTVRFYPVSIILDEDSRPCGHKSVVEEELKEYHKKSHFRDIVEDDYDDAASYASSDLFELDHLAVMGDNNRYHQDLPVYETTHLSTNRAIANGLI